MDFFVTSAGNSVREKCYRANVPVSFPSFPIPILMSAAKPMRNTIAAMKPSITGREKKSPIADMIERLKVERLKVERLKVERR
jgi:hypothetical protein